MPAAKTKTKADRAPAKGDSAAAEAANVATRKFEEKIIPTLRRRHGFRDEVSFFDRDRNESVAISFRDTEADARKYEKDTYPEMAKTLSDTFEGTPDVKGFEVADATWYKIHAS